MARPIKKTVYERIEEALEQKQKKEEELIDLNNHLKELYKEKDDLEMRQLLQQMKNNNLDIQTALEKLTTSKEK